MHRVRPSVRPRGHGLFKFALRLTVSGLLVWLLLRNVPIGDTLSLLQPTVFPFLGASLVVYLASQALCALKWKLIAEPLLENPGFKLRFYISLYYIGMFFSMFLPTTVGGDVARVWYFSRRAGKIKESAASVFLERATGGFGLLTALGVSYSLSETRALAAIPGLGWLLHDRAMAGFIGLIGFLGVMVFGFVGKRFRWVEGMSRTFPRLLWAYGLSIVFYAIFGFAHYLLSLGLGLGISFTYVIFFVTIVSLVSMLPVTLAGIGLREGGYALCLQAAGVPLKNATAFSLLWLLVLLLGALVGGVVYLMGTGRTENGRFGNGPERLV